METIPLWVPLAFFFVALVYASVGFGGGSSYLALLVLVGLSYRVIPQAALVCNLIVSAGGVWHFTRGGHIRLPSVVPFLVLSIPMAYLGGRLTVGKEVFMVLLGASLLVAAGRTFIPSLQATPQSLPPARAWALGLPIGAALGLLAGIVGIGGGIFLAPVLLLCGWAAAKQAAGAASLFILVNSAAGLAGQFSKGVFLDHTAAYLVLAAVIGGQIGSRLGAYHLPTRRVRQLLAMLIAGVGVRLLWGVL